MPNTNENLENLNPLNLRIGSARFKFYTEFITNGIKDKRELACKCGIPERKVQGFIRFINQKMLVNSSVVQTETPVLDNQNGVKSIVLKICEQEDKIILYVKTCSEFEEWLKKNKQVRTTNNLFNQGKTENFYHLKIVNNYNDDINRPIISEGIINFAILRVCGISAGITYELDGLLTQTQLEQSVRKLLNAFNAFYKAKIIAQKINIEAEVIIEEQNGI